MVLRAIEARRLENANENAVGYICLYEEKASDECQLDDISRLNVSYKNHKQNWRSIHQNTRIRRRVLTSCSALDWQYFYSFTDTEGVRLGTGMWTC